MTFLSHKVRTSAAKIAGFSALFGICLLANTIGRAQNILEAENGACSGTEIIADAPGFSGTGYVTGFKNDSNSVSWNFPATNGIYNLDVRYRAPVGGKGFNATVNGHVISGLFPASRGFATHFVGLVELTNGLNSMRVGGGWGYYDIDRAELSPASALPPPLPVPAVPVNPHATPAARKLLADLAADYGKITWSGQHTPEEATNIFCAAGRWPVILSHDFMDFSPTRQQHGARPKKFTENMIRFHDAGYVISMMWHWNAPTNLPDTAAQPWWSGFYTRATTFDVAAALANTNSSEYLLLLRDMDVIAAQLKKFSDRDIPVLWRPLHEAEGRWFWWGAKGPAAFKQLWRLLYQRLTEYHHLNNLIWVLTNENPAWYPGDGVVDIIGVDAYPADPRDPLVTTWKELLLRFDGKKMIALSEFGGVPDVPRMNRLGVRFAYFVPWTGKLGPQGMSPDAVAHIYESSNVLSRAGESKPVKPNAAGASQ